MLTLCFYSGHPPDFDDAIILRSGVSVKHVCHAIHRTLESTFKYALVWVNPFPDSSLQFCHLNLPLPDIKYLLSTNSTDLYCLLWQLPMPLETVT